jgi:hypothetical protein
MWRFSGVGPTDLWKCKFSCEVKAGLPLNRWSLKGLSHEIDFKNFDKNLQNLSYLRDAAGF